MTISLERLEKRALSGQKKLLDGMLCTGISLVYEDERGRMVRENPDGRIDILEGFGNAQDVVDLRTQRSGKKHVSAKCRP